MILRSAIAATAAFVVFSCLCTIGLVESVSVYKGCWEDRGDTDIDAHASPNDRALPGVQLIPFMKAIPHDRRRVPAGTVSPPAGMSFGGSYGVGTVTVPSCIATCDALGFNYAGLGGGDSCFCSHQEPKYRQIDEWRCDKKCNGVRPTPAVLAAATPDDSEPCGGDGVLSVYGNERGAKAILDTRPTVCLLLYVTATDTRDAVLSTIRSVIDSIDAHIIGYDTGVDTELVLKEAGSLLLKQKVPGAMAEVPFQNPAQVWNELATRASQFNIAAAANPNGAPTAVPLSGAAGLSQPVSPVFGLYLVAGEQIHDSLKLRRTLLIMKSSRGLPHSAYSVELFDRNAGNNHNAGPGGAAVVADDEQIRIIRIDHFNCAPGISGGWCWTGRAVPTYQHVPTHAPIELYQLTNPSIEIDRVPQTLAWTGPFTAGIHSGGFGNGASGPASATIRTAFGVSNERYEQALKRRIKWCEEDEKENPHDIRAMINRARALHALPNGVTPLNLVIELYTRAARTVVSSPSDPYQGLWSLNDRYHAFMMAATMLASTIPPVPNPEPAYMKVSTYMQETWSQVQELLFEAYQLQPKRLEAPHAISQHEFNSARFHSSYLLADQLLPPESFVSTSRTVGALVHDLSPRRIVEYQHRYYDRAFAFLYEFEAARLLGFASDRTGHYARCVYSLSHVLMVRPDDTFASTTRDHCQTKLDEDRKHKLKAAQEKANEANGGGGGGDAGGIVNALSTGNLWAKLPSDISGWIGLLIYGVGLIVLLYILAVILRRTRNKLKI